MDKHSTDELLKVLNSIENIKELEAYASDSSNLSSYASFADFLCDKMDEQNISAGELLKRANLHRTYGYQILDGRRNPGRDKVIAICLSLSLRLAETQRALKIAGEAVLYPKKRRDSIIIFSIGKGLSVSETNNLLYEMQEEPLR